MKVKLLKDWIRDPRVDPPQVNVISRKGRRPSPYVYNEASDRSDLVCVAGVELEMSDASAQKWIAEGFAEAVETNGDAR